MVNKERLVKDFIDLASIESLSLKERKFVDALKDKLSFMEIKVYEDNASSKINGEAGNLICTVKGNCDKEPIIFSAHMDTVGPVKNKKIILEKDTIKTDGNSVLGGDDVAGIVTAIEAIRVLKENNIKHGDIQLIFSVAEEIGLRGIKNLDYSKVYGKIAFVLDNAGDIGTVAIKAPAQNVINIKVSGKSAHAGIEPEKGIDAIKIAAHAITKANLGKIDDVSTSNIGIISGGSATNVVCNEVNIKAEVRSLDDKKFDMHTKNLIKCFEESAEKFGGRIEHSVELLYPGFSVDENSRVNEILENAAKEMNIDLNLIYTCAGSDTNILNSKGIEAVDVSVAMEKLHSVEEQMQISNLVKTTEFLIAIIKNT